MKATTSRRLRRAGRRAVACPPGVTCTCVRCKCRNARLIQVASEPGGLAPAEPGDSIARRPSPQIRVRLYTLALVALVVLAVGAIAVYAQAGSGYDLTWNTVDAGGVSFVSSGGYTLGGTAGQPDAAVWSGGGYTLTGGFWHAGEAATAPGGGAGVYLPVILRNR